MKYFYIDNSTGFKIDYTSLIAEINNAKNFKPYCFENNFYRIFYNVIISLLADRQISLFDYDFSDLEIQQITGLKTDLNQTEELSSMPEITSADDLISKIKNAKNWRITLFTSGTTGLPKKVEHDFGSITRMVKSSPTHFDDVWGFAYNPTHIAGLQVFFQALLNQNTIVRLFGLSSDLILKSISSEKITHISATPTFYRLLLPIENEIDSVKRITSGGEKMDTIIVQKLKKAFVNATVLNVYASTEAGTLFASDGDTFTIKPDIINLIKIENQELFINKSLLGKSDSLVLTGDWYATGDLVEVVSENPLKFRFISRKNEMINVGGYKVNPSDVEQALLSIEQIKEAWVYAKKNSVLGNIVCADIVCFEKISIPEINKILRNNLQEFKIPRIINYVDNIKQTRTGKKVRN